MSYCINKNFSSKESPKNQLKNIIKENIRDYQHINSEREPDALGFRTSFGTTTEPR